MTDLTPERLDALEQSAQRAIDVGFGPGSTGLTLDSREVLALVLMAKRAAGPTQPADGGRS